MTNDETYYFENSDPFIFNWEDSSSNNRDASLSGLNYDSENKGFIFNGRDYGVIINPNFELNNYEETIYVEYSTTNNNSSLMYHGSNTEKLTIGLYNDYIIVSNSEQTNLYARPATYSDGNKHSLMATYKDGIYNLYYDGILLEKSHYTDWWSGSNSNSYIGMRANSSRFFTGTIYNVKVFNKEISPDELDNNENLVLNLDGENVIVPSSDSQYISNNNNVPNSTAHSYLTYDLTNIDEDKYLYVNTSISSQSGYDFGYVQVTNSSDIPSNLNKSELKISGVFENEHAVFKLKKKLCSLYLY